MISLSGASCGAEDSDDAPGEADPSEAPTEVVLTEAELAIPDPGADFVAAPDLSLVPPPESEIANPNGVDGDLPSRGETPPDDFDTTQRGTP